uniref:Uncharacterized protein n=1 Tax=Anguilla anguilla TaxID=7936 RepID=A0A0E9QRM1_ANGAN
MKVRRKEIANFYFP